jgi:4-hydroxybenzoate polyprenyltransferase/phosphoserine phosphatase
MKTALEIDSAPHVSDLPLVIDLDGTLLRGDLLQESALRLLAVAPLQALRLPLWLMAGKAALKRGIADRVTLDVATLPYDERVLTWIDEERARGRHLVLCTASDERYAQAVAMHLGRFDEVIASDGQTNVSARRKAARLVERFGAQGFDYAGNSRDDLPVWAAARQAIVVSAPATVQRAAVCSARVAREFPAQSGGLRVWFRALRLHQWLKNLLVFLPLLAGHQLGKPALLAQAALAFLAFGLCASSVYLVNDLVDLESDRRHPRKRLRPFAAGSLSPASGLGAAAALLMVAFALAWVVRPAFAGWLGVYFAGTLAYTFWLKRKLLLDALTLAGLYTLRIIGGAAAGGTTVTFWLLAFSLFLFLSLAFVKRISELQVVLLQGRGSAEGRAYMTQDLALIEMLGVAAGFSAVLVLALYLNSENVVRLYRTPELMWLTVPILLYWISRMWLITHRNRMHDDPLVYAVRDPVSLGCGALFLAVLGLAMLAW